MANRSYRRSLVEHVPETFRFWWAIGMGGVFGILGAIAVVAKSPKVPAWIQDHAVLWFALAGASLLVAQFLAFHKVRIERDESKETLEAVRTGPALAFGDIRIMTFGGQSVEQSQIQIGLNLAHFASTIINYRVESMSVVVENTTAPYQPSAKFERAIPGVPSNIMYPLIRGVDIRAPLSGTLSVSLVYGHPDLGMARRLVETRTFSLFVTGASLFVNHTNWSVQESHDDVIDAG